MLPVRFTGKRIRLSWTYYYPNALVPIVRFNPTDLTNGNDQTATIVMYDVDKIINDGMIYLNCTDITSLYVNGERLI